MKRQYTFLSSEESNAIILQELAENIDRYRRDQEFLLERNRELSNERNEQKARVDDLAQQLAVTECQLEEARERLKRCEGGGD